MIWLDSQKNFRWKTHPDDPFLSSCCRDTVRKCFHSEKFVFVISPQVLGETKWVCGYGSTAEISSPSGEKYFLNPVFFKYTAN